MNSIYIESKTLLENKSAMEYLDNCGVKWYVNGKNFLSISPEEHYIYVCFSNNKFYRLFDINEHYTHTPTALEFCQGVAKIMGIPEPTFEYDKDKAFWDSEEAIIERAKNNPMVIDPELYGAKVETKTYPHKTYRILDSLDGIPLDTRIPLSEWIPPFGVEVTIISDKNLIGKFRDIRKQGYVFYEINTEFSVLITDGHWMRIV